MGSLRKQPDVPKSIRFFLFKAIIFFCFIAFPLLYHEHSVIAGIVAMKQLDLIQSKYRTQLQDYANKHPEYGCMESIWHAIYHADPDRNRHIHTRWLVSRTLDETILWEDIASGSNSKVYTILKRFLAIRKHLSPEQRDLYRYRDLPSVTEAIRPYEDVVTPGEMEQALRERVDRNTVVLYEGNGYKVLVPMSEEASCYWGRGTEWCTAATKSDNMF